MNIHQKFVTPRLKCDAKRLGTLFINTYLWKWPKEFKKETSYTKMRVFQRFTDLTFPLLSFKPFNINIAFKVLVLTCD